MVFNKFIEFLYLKQKDNLVYIDDLTKCYGRHYLKVLKKKYKNKKVLISFLDIDNLKSVNDTYSHSAGNQYIYETIRVLKERNSEICRIGGDEFLIFGDIKLEKNSRYSYGQVLKNEIDDIDEIIEIADIKMYTQKRNKRNKKRKK